MSNRVTIDIVAATGEVNKALTQITGALSAFKTRVDAMAARAAVGFAAVTGALGLAVREAIGAEDAWAKVDAVLISTGQSVEFWGASLREAAAEIQANSRYADEFTAKLLSMSLAMGVSADKAAKLAKDSMALSASTGGAMSPEMAQRALIEASEESYRKLQMYIPALKTATTEQERQAAIAAQLANGYAMVAADAQTLSGTVSRLANAFSDIAENLGNALLPTLRAVADWLIRVVPKIHEWVTNNANLITSIAGFTAGGLGLLAVLPKVLGVLISLGQGVAWLNTAIGSLASGGLAVSRAGFVALLGSIHPLTVAIVALGGVLAYIGYQWVKAKIDAALYSDQLARIEEASKRLAAAEEARSKATTATGRLAAERERVIQLGKLIKEGEKVRAAAIARRDDLVDEQAFGVSGFLGSDKFVALATSPEGNARIAKTEAEIAEISGRISVMKRAYETALNMVDVLQKLADAERDAATATDGASDVYKKRIDELRMEALLLDKKADEAERIKAIEAGATQTEAAKLALSVRRNEALKDELSVKEAIAELNRQAFLAELESGGVTEDGLKIFELGAKGATPEQLDEARTAMERMAAAKRAMAEADKNAGQQLADSLRTEEQITAERIEQLNAALRKGEIDAATHAQALQNIAEEKAARMAAMAFESPLSMYDRIARGSLQRSYAAIELGKMIDRGGGVGGKGGPDPVSVGLSRDMGIIRGVAEWARDFFRNGGGDRSPTYGR